MLPFLLKLGEQLSEEKSVWDDVIEIPKVKQDQDNLVAKLIFDLDQNDIRVEIAGEYKEESPFVHRNIRIKDRRGKYTYVCSELHKLTKIEYSFFGKVDGRNTEPSEGEFKERIDSRYPQLQDTELYKTFDKIFLLRNKFVEEKWSTPDRINKELFGDIPSKSSKVILVYACIVSKNLGYEKPRPMYEIDGFEDYVKLDRLTKFSSTTTKLSYATGLLKEDVDEAAFQTRYGLNYMFVKTTLNFAHNFQKREFLKNYQLNSQEQVFLERASEYVLKNFQVNIAGVSHCIFPKFFSRTKIDLDVLANRAFRKVELLFQQNEYKAVLIDIEDELLDEEGYWVTFLAFESDGNSFKTINIIEDVSKQHLQKIADAFAQIDLENRNSELFDWNGIMSEWKSKNERHTLHFNLNTIYGIIPQRKDKEKKNEALSLFKSILEKRTVSKQLLFKYFKELILCHRYHRYEAYKNIKKYGEDFLDIAIRDAVFKYLGFLQVLKNLNQLSDMENVFDNQLQDVTKVEEISSLSEYQKRIEEFFQKMNFQEHQKALFYLGRMLSSVAYIQKDKKKTVLDKLNFNGMDKKEIVRLRSGLIEKAKQYQEIEKVVFNDSRFNELFDYNNWSVSPQEALFFILSGYSFGINVKSSK